MAVVTTITATGAGSQSFAAGTLVYIVIDINEGGVVFHEGVEGAFDPIYLEAI